MKLWNRKDKKVFSMYFIFKKNNAFFSIVDDRGYIYKKVNTGSERYEDSKKDLKFKTKRLKLHFASYFTTVFPIIKTFRKVVIKYYRRKKIKLQLHVVLKGFRRYKKKLVKKMIRNTYISRYVVSFFNKTEIPHNGCKKKKRRRKKKKKLYLL